MSQKENEHFASMRRTAGENFTFVVLAMIATMATTLLAVGPAEAGGNVDTRIATVAQQY